MRVSYDISSYFDDKLQNHAGNLPKSTFILNKMRKGCHKEPQVEPSFVETHRVDEYVYAQQCMGSGSSRALSQGVQQEFGDDLPSLPGRMMELTQCVNV